MATRTAGSVASGLWVTLIAWAGGAGCQSLELPGGTADFRRDSMQLAQSVQSPFAETSPTQIARASSGIPDQLPAPHGGEQSAHLKVNAQPGNGPGITELPPPGLVEANFGHCRPGATIPNEVAKVGFPPYIIEPPDILLIESPYALPDQPIGGEHLVRPDGTVGLGTYGSVQVAGLTLDEAREVITTHLLQFLQAPIKLTVDVFAYNSKVYYIIMDGAGFGEQVIRLPSTGNETVLDAVGQIGGLPPVSSKKRIWVARPMPQSSSCQILPVDWRGITQCGATETNYQILPGDRIYVQSDRLLALDGLVAKIVTPMERVLGVTLLGSATVNRLQNMGRGTIGGGGF